MNKPIQFLLIGFALVGSYCHADYYATPMLQAGWQVNSSKTRCQMIQDIPYYGSAEFILRAGEKLQFSIQEKRNKANIVKANLATFASPWVHETSAPEVYLVYLDQPVEIGGYGRLAVYGNAAESMIDALLEGDFPTFTYVRAAPDLNLEETRVAVSAIKFSESYENFISCRKQLLPFGFKAVNNKLLFFKNASTTLSTEEGQLLEQLGRYLKAVKKSKVAIQSETALVGKLDRQWFNKRAAKVIQLLTKKGINKNRLSVQSHAKTGNDKTIHIRIFGPDALRWFFFKKGSMHLTHQEKQRLDLLARYAREYYSQGKLVINSHTDSKGPRATNKKISRRRAAVIKNYLQSRGVPAARILVRAYGESRPRTSNRTPKGRAKNRRVEITFSS